MGLNDTVSADRVHIAFFGKRNAGKSSLVNAITNQELSIVSDIKGTTTDPVKKAMELLPIGPVLIIDTPGLDDYGELGEKRIKKAQNILNKTDIAVLVVDSLKGLTDLDNELIAEFKSRKLPYIIAYTKLDLLKEKKQLSNIEIYVSSTTNQGIFEIKEKLGEFSKTLKSDRHIISDLIEENDLVVLVTPIDESAPKGRMILPQVQTIRDVLDKNAIVLTTQPNQLELLLSSLNRKPKIVVTDSQVFEIVDKIVPNNIPLTSFSILFARYKGNLNELTEGAQALKNLKDNDNVLIAEGCTHHRQCNDIGAVKLPNWIEKFSNSKPNYAFVSGGEFPSDLSNYKLIIHCGACMLNEKEMAHRQTLAKEQNIPMVNYGIAIATMHGILDRAISALKN